MRFVLALSLALAPAASALVQAPRAPVPSWFEEVVVPPGAASAGSGLSADWLLVDRQIHVGPGEVDRVHRTVQRVNTPEGVQGSSELRVTYDPSYQRVLFHRARLIRNGRARDALSRADFRRFNREAGLEESLLDGRVSAVLILHDVRPGDVIDLIWSVAGEAPQVNGHFSELVHLVKQQATARYRLRLLWPVSRPLQIRPRGGAQKPRVRELGPEREYLWDAPSAPVQAEADLPDWYDPWPAVELSDFADWGEVARWAAPLFETDPGAVDSIVAPWRQLPESERAARALVFVREQIRYFGMEMGVHAHKPHSPALVLQRRFGDCKDKTLLLVALLRALGVEAAPALVNTVERRGLDQRLPSAWAFDHAIVRARVDGAERWLDATLTSQRGPIAALPSPGYERALVLRPDTTGLTRMPDPDASKPLELVEQVLRARGADAQVQVVSTYAARQADQQRSRMASTLPDAVGREYLDFYRKFEPRIEQVRPPVLRDEAETGRYVVDESYTIPGFWDGGSHEWVLDTLFRLRKPRDFSTRTMPLAVPYPMHVVHRARIETPPDRELQMTHAVRTIIGPGFKAELRTSVSREKDGPVVLVAAELTTTAAEIAPEQVREYARAIDELADALHVPVRLAPRRTQAAVGSGAGGEGILLLALAGIVLGLMWAWPHAMRRLDAARQRRFLRRTIPGRGESAANPLSVSTPEELRRHLSSRRCACGQRLDTAATSAGESSVVGRRTVHAVRLQCACGQVSFVYFEET